MYFKRYIHVNIVEYEIITYNYVTLRVNFGVPLFFAPHKHKQRRSRSHRSSVIFFSHRFGCWFGDLPNILKLYSILICHIEIYLYNIYEINFLLRVIYRLLIIFTSPPFFGSIV